MEQKNQIKLYNLDIWVYNRIKFFNDKDMECFESNESMSELFNRHKNRISASIQKLIKEGYIINNGKNKYERRLKITEKVINICGVSINKNDVSINNLSVEEITKLLKGINKNGVEQLTKAVLAIDKNGDIYKELNKYYKKEIKKENKLSSEDFSKIYKTYNSNCRVIPDKDSISYKRTCVVVNKLGGVEELINQINDYLDMLKTEDWRQKKGYDAWMNSPEHYGATYKKTKSGIDWKALIKAEEEKERQNA